MNRDSEDGGSTKGCRLFARVLPQRTSRGSLDTGRCHLDTIHFMTEFDRSLKVQSKYYFQNNMTYRYPSSRP